MSWGLCQPKELGFEAFQSHQNVESPAAVEWMTEKVRQGFIYLFWFSFWGFLFVFSETVNSERNCEGSRICSSRWKVGHPPARGAVGVRTRGRNRREPRELVGGEGGGGMSKEDKLESGGENRNGGGLGVLAKAPGEACI